jgi:hypothetical protein
VLAFAAGAFFAAAALVVLVAAALVVFAALGAAAVFFAAGAFLAAAALVVFLVVVVVTATGDSSFFAAAFLAGFAVSAPASGLASFTGPEAPMEGDYVSNGKDLDDMIMIQCDDRHMSRLAISVDQHLGNTAYHALHRSLGRRTLRAGEDTRLGALGESTVEQRGELSVVDVAEFIVGKNVLLESLATVGKQDVSKMCQAKSRRLARVFRHTAAARWRKLLTSYLCVP